MEIGRLFASMTTIRELIAHDSGLSRHERTQHGDIADLSGEIHQNKLFCFDVPHATGVAVELEPQEGDGPLTTRERLAQHRDDPACYGCQLMDLMGLAFENSMLSACGGPRRLPIDASVEFGGQDTSGVAPLGNISRSRRFGDCVTIQFFDMRWVISKQKEERIVWIAGRLCQR